MIFFDAIFGKYTCQAGRSDTWSDDSRRTELADRSEETLREHLLWQLEMEHFTPREVVIGQTIVDSVNEDGYLTEPLDNIQRILSGEARFTLAEIEETLTKIQALARSNMNSTESV